MLDVYKAKMPIKQDSNYYYPITTFDQIILPDGTRWDGNTALGGTQSDWNVNDAEDPAYVKNRTHWEENNIIHQLDEKFIPDTIARTSDIVTPVQSDWDENDETSAAYVKNRPFYNADDEQVLYNGTIKYYGSNVTISGFGITAGVTYIVFVNGVREEGTAKSAGTGTVLSTDSMYLQSDRWGSKQVHFYNGNGSYSLKIIRPIKTPIKIDQKYLPSGTPVLPVTSSNNGSIMKVVDGVWGLGEQIQADWDEQNANKTSFIHNKPNFDALMQTPKHYISLIDQITGDVCLFCVQNGELRIYGQTDHIEITTMPNKTEYVAGDVFDPAGMVISAVDTNGVARVIADYTYTKTINYNQPFIRVTYIEAQHTYTIDVPLTVTPLDIAALLVDFDYIDNGDGTYTLTDWKGTLNGVSSTQMVIPDKSIIIL